MDELESNQSSNQNRQLNSSFQSLGFNGSQSEERQEQQSQILSLQKYKGNDIKQMVKESFKMCFSGIRTLKTNFVYNLKHSKFQIFTKRQKVILNKNQQITLLGRIYKNLSKQKQKFYLDFNDVIWLTYRSGICGFQSDAGWGCMIRVCQMLLAETFKRVAPHMQLNRIVDFFRDTPEAYFSLIRICEKGNIKERWTSSIQIFTLLKLLLVEFKQIVLNIDIHSSCIQLSTLKQLEEIEYPTIVFVSNRLGKTKFSPQYKEHFLQIMKIPSFLGAIGGNGGQALYLIGSYCQKIIFMDPHYVQSSQYEQQDKNTSTYFQSQPYSINVNQLASSVAFNFLVNSKQEYLHLLTKLYQQQMLYHPCACLQIHSAQLQKRIKARKLSDDIFEVIQ